MDNLDLSAKLMNVFRKYGYEGATLSIISKATGLKRASLYYRFPGGKEEMAMFVLKEIRSLTQKDTLEPAYSKEIAPLKKLQIVLNSIVNYYKSAEYACVWEIFTIGAFKETFIEEIKSQYYELIEAIASVLKELGFSHDEASKKATHFFLQIQGGLLVVRFDPSQYTLFDEFIQSFMESLELDNKFF